MESPHVLVKRLRADAQVPEYKSAGAAGMDLVAAIDGPIAIEPRARAAIGTGLAFAIPRGFEGQVRPRSGLAREHGLTVANAPGTIDADYRGECIVLLVNLGDRAVLIESGQRIAQLVIAPVAHATLELLPADVELPATARGAGGFGSTGA